MAVATRLSFQSGFFGYLNQVEAQRLDALTATLAAEYRRHGDWGFVRDNYARLRELAAPAQPIQRLALLDEARRRVVGNPELPEDAAVRPVIVDDASSAGSDRPRSPSPAAPPSPASSRGRLPPPGLLPGPRPPRPPASPSGLPAPFLR